jgi:hypothetical protein
MSEVSHAGEDHGNTKFITLLDGIFITDRSTWLDDGSNTILGSQSDGIIKWEERIRS